MRDENGGCRTLTERRGASRVDCYDEISLIRKHVRIPPRRPAIIPHPLRACEYKTSFSMRPTGLASIDSGRASMNEQQSRPPLLVAFLPPVRLDDIPVHLLPFRPFKVKIFRGTQRLPHQRFLGEGGDPLGRALPLELTLGLGEIRLEFVQPADDEHVVRSLERGAGEYEPAIGSYLDGSDGAVVRERPGGGIFGRKRRVSGRLVRSIWDREDIELVARVIASSQVKELGVMGELRYVSTYLVMKTTLPALTASSSADRSQGCVSV